MPWIDVIWSPEARSKVAEHGLGLDEVEHIIRHGPVRGHSRTSGRPVAAGHTPAGRHVLVVYEWLDAISVVPITAYPIEE